MTIIEIADLIDGKILGSQENINLNVDKAFASDLMSDVLTVEDPNVLLVTGLSNLQTIRTAEMADLKMIVIGRNKIPTEEMIALAEDCGITIIQSPFSLFRISGMLYQRNIQPLY
jgi:predicted transcriptional regulator